MASQRDSCSGAIYRPFAIQNHNNNHTGQCVINGKVKVENLHVTSKASNQLKPSNEDF